MRAVGADVIDSVGLAFGQDVSPPEGELSVAEDKAARLAAALDRIDSLVGSPVA